METGEHTKIYLPNALLDDLADENGLAIILADERSTAVSKSNNNSMCEMLYNSESFAPECDRYCGEAFRMATEAGESVGYKCYAGLNCLAVNMRKEEKQIVAIIGRAFTKADDYRDAANRAVEGDWQQFPANRFFENVLLSNSDESLQKLAGKVGKLQLKTEPSATVGERSALSQQPTVDSQPAPVEITNPTADIQASDSSLTELRNENSADHRKPFIADSKSKHWRSAFGSLLESNYRQSCILIAQFVADRFAVENVAWLERKEDRLEIAFAAGKLKEREIKLNIGANDERLIEAADREIPLELRERKTEQSAGESLTIRLFPITVGGEVQSALVVGDDLDGQEKQLARFCRQVASDLEILRLRERLAQRGLLERAVRQFNENLENIDSEDFWTHLTNISAALLQAERSSLLVFDEKSDTFITKAATGIRADFIKRNTANLGERISRNVLSNGAAVVVEDIRRVKLPPAPEDWLYKSDSFISYPITIGERKIGVLNLTDRAGGEVYSEIDLEILNSIMPQLAVLIDRANLKNKAGEFEQLSVTDALTGLLNRRYLEERLTEEIKRSNRHGFPMSFLMIDVDEFKSYNDNFGHTEGDKALQIVGTCLKETLRGADVAARYGGEEFSILLPQTNSEEASVIAERVRERVANSCFPSRRVTISIGIASCSLTLNSAKDLISAADKALYEAKRTGRNNVQIYENLK